MKKPVSNTYVEIELDEVEKHTMKKIKTSEEEMHKFPETGANPSINSSHAFSARVLTSKGTPSSSTSTTPATLPLLSRFSIYRSITSGSSADFCGSLGSTSKSLSFENLGSPEELKGKSAGFKEALLPRFKFEEVTIISHNEAARVISIETSPSTISYHPLVNHYISRECAQQLLGIKFEQNRACYQLEKPRSVKPDESELTIQVGGSNQKPTADHLDAMPKQSSYLYIKEEKLFARRFINFRACKTNGQAPKFDELLDYQPSVKSIHLFVLILVKGPSDLYALQLRINHNTGGSGHTDLCKKDEGGELAFVLGAGEFYLRDKKIVMVDTKSGNFHAEIGHFKEYQKELLTEIFKPYRHPNLAPETELVFLANSKDHLVNEERDRRMKQIEDTLEKVKESQMPAARTISFF